MPHAFESTTLPSNGSTRFAIAMVETLLHCVLTKESTCSTHKKQIKMSGVVCAGVLASQPTITRVYILY